MARSFGVQALVDRVRVIGDYVELTGSDGYASSYMTDPIVIEALSVANAEVHEFYADSDEDYRTTRQTYSLVSGSTYDLPSDLMKIRLVEVRPGGGSTGWVPLRRASADDNLTADDMTVEPESYRLLGDDIELLPTPTAGTMRITYVPCAPVLSSSLQSVDGVNGYDQVLVLRAVRYLRMREGLATTELDALIADGEARMRTSVRRRDRGTPRKLRDPRASSYGWPRWTRRNP